ncbi:MAG: TrkA family potassium uptake protein [Haloferacaceae archaeon]
MGDGDGMGRRIAYYLVLLVAVMLGYALVYDYGMTALEGRPTTFLHALQVVVETFTTTGYGSDAPWTTPGMNALVIVMDLTGVALIFIALPVLAFPLFEAALSTTVPTVVEESLRDHVVICTHTPRAERLIAELDSREVAHVIVEPDRERARELYEGHDHRVVHGDPEAVDDLRNARLSAARALVADVSDRIDASIVLAAKEVDDDARVVSVIEEPDRVPYHELAGADAVVSPRPLLGRSLADKVTASVRADLGDAVEIGDDFEVAELPVHRDSDLAGTTLAESGLRERAGINVIGAWFRGEFVTPPSPDAALDAGTVLLVTGREDQLDRLRDLARSSLRRGGRGPVLVIGYGEVGSSAVDALAAAGVSYTIVDVADEEAVDVVGDATDPAVLRRAGVEDARSAVLALPDDTLTEFATLVIRDLAPSTEIVARAEEGGSTRKMYRAGADYVLSLSTVAGRMLASAVLEEEEVISADTQVDVVRTRAPGLVGRTLGDAQVRSQTGCTVVAVERDGEVVTDVGPHFQVQAGDDLIVAGTDEGTNRFVRLLG